MPERKTFVLTIGRSYYPWVIAFSVFSLLAINGSGIYWGSTRQEAKDQKQIAEAKQALKDQALMYEKRLGEQSARYAQESTSFVGTLSLLNDAINNMQKQNKQAAIERQTALKQAVAAAQAAANEARTSRERITELTKQQQETKVSAAVAASAASKAAAVSVETQQTLENATQPQAVIPPAPVIQRNNGRK
jgi:hypothetical protein